MPKSDLQREETWLLPEFPVIKYVSRTVTVTGTGKGVILSDNFCGSRIHRTALAQFQGFVKCSWQFHRPVGHTSYAVQPGKENKLQEELLKK